MSSLTGLRRPNRLRSRSSKCCQQMRASRSSLLGKNPVQSFRSAQTGELSIWLSIKLHYLPGVVTWASHLQIAKAIAERQPDVQIIVLSDGNAKLPERMTISGIVKFISIGKKNENQAIQLLNLQANPSNRSLSAFAQVANYSASPVKRRLSFFADGTLANAFDLEIAANGEQAVLAEGIISTTQVIEARLMPDNSAADFLGLDDMHTQFLNRSNRQKWC